MVTQHDCHAMLAEFRQDCLAFIDNINRDPLPIITLLWLRFDLEPALEKLWFSF